MSRLGVTPVRARLLVAETKPGGRLLWWLVAVSLVLHLLLIGLSLLRKRADADFSQAPSYDLVFEGSPQAAAEHVLPPSQPADMPLPPDAPVGPPAPTPSAVPSPDGTTEPQAEPATVPPTPADSAPSAPPPAPPPAPAQAARPAPSPPPATTARPSPPAATAPPTEAPPPPVPLSTTEPAPIAAAPPSATPAPQAVQPRQAEPEINLRPPSEASPAPPQSRDFEMPAPPPPLPPLPAPTRPRRATPPRSAFGTLAQPMDLSFAPRPAARSMAIARGLDLSVPFSAQRTALTGPYAAIRAAKASEDWNRSLLRYWLEHRYYPQEAAQAGESGTVTIELTVARSGQVESVRVLSRSGSQWLDMAAVGTFRGAKLRPFTEEMQEDRLTFPVPITYYLVRR